MKKYFIILGIAIVCFNSVWRYAQITGTEDITRTPLKVLAQARGRYIGTAIDIWALMMDKKYSQVAAQEFNVVTPENVFKFYVTEPQRNLFFFMLGDTIVDFAKSNNMKIRAHTLVWYQQIPGWLTKRKYSKEEMEEILHNHIKVVAGHFKGKVYCWDVVNEAFEKDGSFRHSIWYDAIGPEYIEMAFRWAHEADPDALLFYNDYGVEISNAKSDAIYLFLKKLKEKGIPVDGIGFQQHIKYNYRYSKEVDSNIKRFAKIGLETDFTELDVSIIAADQNVSRESELKQQADVFKNTAMVCLDNPSCKMIVMWGFTDAHTWMRSLFNKEDAPTIFDEHYDPKPAYYAIKKAFQS